MPAHPLEELGQTEHSPQTKELPRNSEHAFKEPVVVLPQQLQPQAKRKSEQISQVMTPERSKDADVISAHRLTHLVTGFDKLLRQGPAVLGENKVQRRQESLILPLLQPAKQPECWRWQNGCLCCCKAAARSRRARSACPDAPRKIEVAGTLDSSQLVEKSIDVPIQVSGGHSQGLRLLKPSFESPG